MTLALGTKWANRYEIQSVLGTGGMGIVYLARDTVLDDELVALKILQGELRSDTGHRKRFLREVQLTRRVTHPNVVRTFDVGEENGFPFFSMEYVEGPTLKEVYTSSPIKFAELCNIIAQIADGLQSIHDAGIIHRDLKSSNVILSSGGLVKISDFGVAQLGDIDISTNKELIGSTPYMAPEIWKGNPAEYQSDLYSLGILCHELCTGQLPFDGENPAELMCKHLSDTPPPLHETDSSIPIWFSQIVLALLAKTHSERPQSAREVGWYIWENSGLSSPHASRRSSGTIAPPSSSGNIVRGSLPDTRTGARSTVSTDSGGNSERKPPESMSLLIEESQKAKHRLRDRSSRYARRLLITSSLNRTLIAFLVYLLFSATSLLLLSSIRSTISTQSSLFATIAPIEGIALLLGGFVTALAFIEVPFGKSLRHGIFAATLFTTVGSALATVNMIAATQSVTGIRQSEFMTTVEKSLASSAESFVQLALFHHHVKPYQPTVVPPPNTTTDNNPLPFLSATGLDSPRFVELIRLFFCFAVAWAARLCSRSKRSRRSIRINGTLQDLGVGLVLAYPIAYAIMMVRTFTPLGAKDMFVISLFGMDLPIGIFQVFGAMIAWLIAIAISRRSSKGP